jgi:hypothetical protein
LKVSSFLQPVKDALGLKLHGIYGIPSKCGKVYIGQTGHSNETGIKQHYRHIQLYNLEKLAMAEHSINLLHSTQFNDTSILAKKKPGSNSLSSILTT